jgi:hypothetical protein
MNPSTDTPAKLREAAGMMRSRAERWAAELNRHLPKTIRGALIPWYDPELTRRRIEERSRSVERDAEENRATALPPTEVLSLRSLSVVEAFPPSHVDALRGGLERLGWLRSAGWRAVDRDQWLNRMRWAPGATGWSFLGSMVPEQEANTFDVYAMGALPTALPQGVARISATLVQRCPSFTELVVLFVLDDASAVKIAEPFRRAYRTEIRRIGTSFSHHSPVALRAEASGKFRTEIRERCTRWLCERIPGMFAARNDLTYFPTCELFTLEETTPFETPPADGGFLAVLGLELSWAAFAAENLPGLRLTDWVGAQGIQNALVLAGRESDVLAGAAAIPHTAWSTRTLPSYVHEETRDSLATWGLHCALKVWEEDVARYRDMVAQVDVHHLRRALPALRRIERLRVELARDAIPCSTEFALHAGNSHAFFQGLRVFTECRAHGRKPASFFEWIRKSISTRVQHLTQREAQLREHIQTISTLLSAETSERVARSNVRLQWLVVALSILAVGLAYCSRSP